MIVIPAKAGTQNRNWAPAFAGVTKWFVFVLGLLVLATAGRAQTLPPRPQTPVLDQAKLLRPEQVIDIETKAQALHDQTGRTFFVAIVNSLDDMPIEDYGTQLGRAWKVGTEKEDDGVILIIAPKERQLRIETGYGAEGFLPDILAGRIIRDTIVPRFKAGDMGGGVTAGADQIIKAMSLPAQEAKRQADTATRQERASRDGFNFGPIIFWGMIIAFVLLSMGRRAGGRRYRSRRGGINPWVVLWGLNELSRASRGNRGWGGGGWSGGGFGGFGGGGGGSFGGFGGGFGGGGASGSW